MAKVKAEDVPENEDIGIGEDWGKSDVPFIALDSLLGVPIFVYAATVIPSTLPDARPGSLWATFDAILLKEPKHGELALKSGEVGEGFTVGSRISSSTGSAGCTAVLKSCIEKGFNPGRAMMVAKRVTAKSDKGRTMSPVDVTEYADAIVTARAIISGVVEDEDEGE